MVQNNLYSSIRRADNMPAEIEYEAPELHSLRRAAMVDGVIKFAAYTTAIGSLFLAPNAVQAFDKPLAQLDKTMDERKRRREILQTVYYMKSRGYLAGNYEHGLQLTAKAKRRLAKITTDAIRVRPIPVWDGHWHIVIYDIPEAHKTARQSLAGMLRQAGCFQLQKSTWITPFPCREEVAALSSMYGVDTYVTYFEAVYLDNAAPLIKRFARKYPLVDFAQGIQANLQQ